MRKNKPSGLPAKDIKWEQTSTTSKGRALGGKKTTTTYNKMDYTGIKPGSSLRDPKKVGELTETTKTNRKGDVVRSKKVITSANSDLKTVVTTNRRGKQKIKTKK